MGFADGFLVMFSLDDAKSFEDAKVLAVETKEAQRKPIIFVGNKKV